MTNRSENVIDFPTDRVRAAPDFSRSPKRQVDRLNEANDLLDGLRRRKRRIVVVDRQFLAANLGRLIMEIERSDPKVLAKKILGDKWEKRMRYVRFPDDASDARYAASGGHFAGLIDQLIETKVGKGLDRAHATKETVYGALKGTSFLPASRFQMPEGGDGEAAYLVSAMEKAFDKLAQDADLAEHFERVSKYPIYPDCPYWWSSSSLTLDAKSEPNDIYDWDWITDEDEIEIQSIPWWAPRCVIGHLYVPFQIACLDLPEQGVADLKKACGGEVTPDTWRTEHSRLLEPFLISECVRPRTVYHRLPVLLSALPRPNRLVPCLYVAIGHPTGFQEDNWPFDDNPMMPCFVAKIGDQINGDNAFFHDTSDDEHETFYISAANSHIVAIGSGIDDELWEFTPDIWFADATYEIPDWLQSHPVQKLLKLTSNSDTATHFALTRRHGDTTTFRPAFPDPFIPTALRHDTIGAYLLRSLSGVDGVFEALKSDAFKKVGAVKGVIGCELSKFQDAFDAKFGK